MRSRRAAVENKATIPGRKVAPNNRAAGLQPGAPTCDICLLDFPIPHRARPDLEELFEGVGANARPVTRGGPFQG